MAESIIPLTLVKTYLHVEHDLEDELIESLVSAMAQKAFHTCGQSWGALNLPEAVQTWILMRVAYAYENRAAMAEGGAPPIRDYVDGLLDPFLTLAV